MELKITTRDKALTDELLQNGGQLQAPVNVSVQFKGIGFKKSLDAPEIAAFLVTVAAHVPAALAADLVTAWILGKFYGHSEIESISINETEMRFSKSGKMRKIIKRQIKKERRRG
jgi:hypothetical protein